MIGTIFTNPFAFILSIAALIIAITIHEFAHAYMADRLGDPTPRLQGRITLNPLAHLDPLGTLFLLLVRFGWGKPVQFDPFNLRNPQRDSALISLAGPASNLLLAIVASVALRLVSNLSIFNNLILLFSPFISLNIVLAIFNLLPFHPLDGFKIVGGFLSHEQYLEWRELEPYGIFFLFILLFPFGNQPLIANLINPPIDFLLNLLLPPIVTLNQWI